MNGSGNTPEWMTLHVTVAPEMSDAINDFCVEHGSQGVVLEDTSSGQVRITGYFARESWEDVHADLTAYLASLHELFPELPEPSVTATPLKHENWAIAWKDSFTSLTIGKRLVVTPPWIKPEAGGREVVVIDPAEAFGTGTHETTQGCLVLLEEATEALSEKGEPFSMLDVGCGSGILAIAGVKLGAEHVTAIDNDPVAVASARKNTALNGVENRLQLRCALLEETTEPADIVTANLDPKTLLACAGTLFALAKRFLIVSGVPSDQWDHVKEKLANGPLRLKKEVTRSEWGCGLYCRIG